MTIDEMIEKKRELGMNNEMISEASGAAETVQEIFGNLAKSPSRLTIQAIESTVAGRREESH